MLVFAPMGNGRGTVASRLIGGGAAWILLGVSFFVSGAAALTYQVCWQRALYGAIGVDTDSVTLIVSAFMLGIGIGGALGGAIADALPRRLVWAYALVEGLLALFGAFSLDIIALVSGWFGTTAGLPATGAGVFALLVVPTTLMGATLPLLTIAFDRRVDNIGRAVGTLYFWNTLGAACACALWPFLLFDYLGLDQAVRLAAAGNFLVACAAVVAMTVLRVSDEPAAAP
jgi:predicted membrane-bound spermidine synthase